MASQSDGVPVSAKKPATQYPWNRVVLTRNDGTTSNPYLIAIPAASHKRKTAPLLPGRGREQLVGVSTDRTCVCKARISTVNRPTLPGSAGGTQLDAVQFRIIVLSCRAVILEMSVGIGRIYWQNPGSASAVKPARNPCMSRRALHAAV